MREGMRERMREGAGEERKKGGRNHKVNFLTQYDYCMHVVTRG